MRYIQDNTFNLSFPPFSDQQGVLPESFSFFKHMCSKKKNRNSEKKNRNYDLFSESEWRIICSPNIITKMTECCSDRLRAFVDPLETRDLELKAYFESIQERPDYFLPLDAWLAIIIYPSPDVKNCAISDPEIRDLIRQVKNQTTLSGCPDYEYRMWPIEVDLDACSHF